VQRHTRFCVTSLSLALLAFAGSSQAQSGCKFVDFNYPGALQTTAESINNLTHVVGTYFDSTGTIQRGFLYKNGKFSSFSGPNRTNTTQAHGINNKGQIVGGYYDATSGYFKGFLIDSAGFHTLSVPSTGDVSAEGINDAGIVVGTISNADGSQFGFTLVNGKVKTFQYGTLPTSAHGINNANQIVGSYDNETGTRIGYILTNGVYETFTVGDQFTEPMKINKAGEAAGFAFDSVNGHSSFVYAQQSIVPISQAGTSGTDVFGINDNDYLVGGVMVTAGSHEKEFGAQCTNVF